MTIQTNPCKKCQGKENEACPCADKTVYEINQIKEKKAIRKSASVECYQRRKTNEINSRKKRRFFA